MIQKTQKSTPCEDYLAWCKKRNELKKLIFQEKMEGKKTTEPTYMTFQQ